MGWIGKTLEDYILLKYSFDNKGLTSISRKIELISYVCQ